MAFFVPALLSTVAAGITYNGKCKLGFLTDAEAISNPEELASYFGEEVEILHKAVKNTSPLPPKPVDHTGPMVLSILAFIGIVFVSCVLLWQTMEG